MFSDTASCPFSETINSWALRSVAEMLSDNDLTVGFVVPSYMWQSRVEIEQFSVAYFNHIAVFKALAVAQNFH